MTKFDIRDSRAGRTSTIGPPSAAFVVMSMFGRAHVWAAAIAGGVVAACAMFLATAVLLIQGAPPGVEIGPNLAALRLFWPGYSVTWAGSVIGALYAGAVGAALGFIVALFWNFAHIVVVGVATLSGNWLEKD
ncbi:MAG: hypothetical protein L0Z50_19030 [Verrucomicrobiales bacterium]|nr:hypothetical protein [Verrucomicrobiales bacterium]